MDSISSEPTILDLKKFASDTLKIIQIKDIKVIRTLIHPPFSSNVVSGALLRLFGIKV